MSSKKFVVATFDDEKVLFPAVKNVRKSGLKIHDVYTHPLLYMGLTTKWALEIQAYTQQDLYTVYQVLHLHLHL